VVVVLFSNDIYGQFQSPALKSQRVPRSAEPYNTTLLIGKIPVLSFLHCTYKSAVAVFNYRYCSSRCFHVTDTLNNGK